MAAMSKTPGSSLFDAYYEELNTSNWLFSHGQESRTLR